MKWVGPIGAFMRDTTRNIDLEGGFRAGKTTGALWKVLKSCLDNHGIFWLVCRYGDGDTQSKLKPPWRDICYAAGIEVAWNPDAMYDLLPNGSRVYLFGLKAQDQVTRYAKLRGLTLAGIYVDQAEELPYDVYLELKGRLSQSGHPHQLILTPNPPDENHWLAKEYPEDNHKRGHAYYSVSIHDNAHNLPAETVPGLLEAYPPGHAKHRSAVLGKRGLNVIGEPVYAGAFKRSLHERALVWNPHLPILEGIDFGKHHPCVMWRQYTPYGQCLTLGGIMGQNLFLEDFAPLIQQYRAAWFPVAIAVMSCCDPAGAHDNSQGVRQNGIEVLKDHAIAPQWQENSNAPDVRLAMVERHAGYMRKRAANGDEAFGIEANPERWLRISPTLTESWRFYADGCEAGYVWDEHMVSVGSKQIRKPKKDGWYEHGQNVAEYLELNFGGAQPTVMQADRWAERIQARAERRAQRDVDDYDVIRQRTGRRAGVSRRGYL